MGLIDAGDQARLDRYIGYYEPYATSHDALDRDDAVQEETRNVARAVARVTARCAGASSPPSSQSCHGRDRSSGEHVLKEGYTLADCLRPRDLP